MPEEKERYIALATCSRRERKRHWTRRTPFKVPLCLFFRMVALITKALEWLVTIVSDPILRHSITFGTTIRMKPAVAQRVSILLLWRQWFTYGLWYTDRKSIIGATLQGRTNLFPLFVQFSLQSWLEIDQVQKSSSLFFSVDNASFEPATIQVNCTFSNYSLVSNTWHTWIRDTANFQGS